MAINPLRKTCVVWKFVNLKTSWKGFVSQKKLWSWSSGWRVKQPCSAYTERSQMIHNFLRGGGATSPDCIILFVQTGRVCSVSSEKNGTLLWAAEVFSGDKNNLICKIQFSLRWIVDLKLSNHSEKSGNSLTWMEIVQVSLFWTGIHFQMLCPEKFVVSLHWLISANYTLSTLLMPTCLSRCVWLGDLPQTAGPTLTHPGWVLGRGGGWGLEPCDLM